MLESVTPAEWQQYYVRAQLVQADSRQGRNQLAVDVVADEVNRFLDGRLREEGLTSRVQQCPAPPR